MVESLARKTPISIHHATKVKMIWKEWRPSFRLGTISGSNSNFFIVTDRADLEEMGVVSRIVEEGGGRREEAIVISLWI